MYRDNSIDLLKFLAVLLITNSHFDKLYPESISFLGTGGAIGDALFFFCSGFTLFLKPMGQFDNWYKKRISRVYPTILSWSIILAFVLNKDQSIKEIILTGGGWFVNCILIYYIVLYFINKFFSQYLNWTFIIFTLGTIIVYCLWEKGEDFKMYGFTFYKWIFFFLYMLMGAIIGKKSITLKWISSFIGLFISLFGFYVILIISKRCVEFNNLQLLSLVPLCGIVIFLYTLCNCNKIKSILKKKYIGGTILFLGGMCLEIYITQNYFLTIDLKLPFPLNFIVMIAIIIIASYFLKCTSKLFLQTFSKNEYSWKEIFNILPTNK